MRAGKVAGVDERFLIIVVAKGSGKIFGVDGGVGAAVPRLGNGEADEGVVLFGFGGDDAYLDAVTGSDNSVAGGVTSSRFEGDVGQLAFVIILAGINGGDDG